MKALIIEDDLSSVTILSALLSVLGFQSQAVSSIEGAKKYLEEQRPDILFLDLFFSDEDGLDFLRYRMMTPDLASVPVIITSCSSHFETISGCLKEGATSYLIKPIQMDLLAKTIKKVGLFVK